MLIHQQAGYVEAPISSDGFRRSHVLAADVRLVREREEAGMVFFRLDVR